ncbi:MAG TPA: hypothetical protein DCX53_08025 [Anaerolineae bacterium]|nr:hypothetical protein [Anaerolineae bacterium]
MHRTLITAYCLLALCLSACLPDIFIAPALASPSETSLFVYRFDSPAFVGYSEELQHTKEIPFSFPVSCGLYNAFPAPMGLFLAIELSCPNGQSVLFLDTEIGTITLPFTETDSHFLAWAPDGRSAYLKVDSLSNPQIVRAYVSGAKDIIPITEFTYDLSTKPDSNDFIFTFSRGLGYGSELYLAQNGGRETQLLYIDQSNYISFARYSPDGEQIAFIKIPDSQTPFTVGELWIIPSTVDSADTASSSVQGGKFLAYADAGHGYAANWSPDGKQLAFVVRENPENERANQSSDDLISNIYVVDVTSGELTQVTFFDDGHVETPYWSLTGNILAFNVVINGRMQVHIADMASGEIKPLETGPTCCPAWMRK